MPLTAEKRPQESIERRKYSGFDALSKEAERLTVSYREGSIEIEP